MDTVTLNAMGDVGLQHLIARIALGVHVITNSSTSGQNDRHFTDDIFKCIFLSENVRILVKTSLKFVPQGPIDNIPALV